MKSLSLAAALTLGRPMYGATETGMIIVAAIVGAAFTLYVAHWAWRMTA